MATRSHGEKHDLAIKLLLIGDSGVGKSCLLLRFSMDSFSSTMCKTLGVDFKTRKMVIKDKLVRIAVWDTAGQERFRTITQTYYRDAMGAVIVYDITSRYSFDNIRDWLRSLAGRTPDDCDLMLVGNKCDMDDGRRAVSYAEGEALAQEFGMKFFETSAKEDIHVDEAFIALSHQVVERLTRQELDAGSQSGAAGNKVQLGASGAQKSTGCCS